MPGLVAGRVPVRRFVQAIVVGVFVLVAAGCGPALAPGDEPVDVGAGADPVPTVTPTPPPTLTAPPPTPAPTATPDLPEGWREVTRDRLRVTFYAPEAYELSEGDGLHLDLREGDGPGWLEINVLDESTAGDWGVAYYSGMATGDLLDGILASLRENGVFDDPYPLLTRGGRTARVTAGTYRPLDEHMMVAVLTLPERALLIIGHGQPTDEPGTWQALLDVYQDIVWSLVEMS